MGIFFSDIQKWGVLCLRSILFAALFCLGSIGAVNAEGPSQTELAWAADRLENVDGIQTVLESCPADIKGTRKTWRHWLFFNRNAWSFSNCNANIETCLRACTDNLDGSACRAVGRIFEKFGGPEYDFNRRQGYALACALGNASGCTNRGASIRKSKTKVDVLTQSDPEKLALCQTRTFAAACSDGDAWGCAMEGQARRFGEGVPVDFTKAREKFVKACALHPGPEKKNSDAAPCRFARRLMENMPE